MELKPVNPLLKHFRQPAIYLKLPSGGQYYAEGSLEMPTNEELPVYPLTARDEVILKTPDALINGNSVIEVVQSCIPAIKDAWKMPSVDLDAIFIAIRIASYGHSLPITVKCPKCGEEHEYEVDLRNTLGRVTMPDYSGFVDTQGLKIKLKPQPYLSVNSVNSLRFEEQRMIAQLSNTSVPEEQRLAAVKAQMEKISNINLEVLVDSTEYIQTDNNTIVTDKGFIFEFYQNADNKIIKKIDESFTNLNKQSGSKPEQITCGSCGHSFQTTVEFDYSNFFGTGS
jgi:transcription elongation factor Elf1